MCIAYRRETISNTLFMSQLDRAIHVVSRPRALTMAASGFLS